MNPHDTQVTRAASQAPGVVTDNDSITPDVITGTKNLTVTLVDSFNNTTESPTSIDTAKAIIKEGLTVETPQLVNDTTTEWPSLYDREVNTSTITDIDDTTAGSINTSSESYNSFSNNGTDTTGVAGGADTSTGFEDTSQVVNSTLEKATEDTGWGAPENTTWDVTQDVTTQNDFLERASAVAEDVTAQDTSEQTLRAVTDSYDETTSDYLDALNDTSVQGNNTSSFGNNTTYLEAYTSDFGNDRRSENDTWSIVNDTLTFNKDTSLFGNDTQNLVNDTSIFGNETLYDSGLSDVVKNATNLLYNASDSFTDQSDYSEGTWNVSTESIVSSSWDLLENVTATASTVLSNVTETDLINASLIEDDRYFATYDWLDLNQSDTYIDQPHYVYSLQYYLGEMIIVTILLGILTLWTIIGNLLVLISLFKFKNLKTMSNYLIGNLALCDFLLSLTVLPMSLINDVLGHWLFGEVLCNIWLSIDVLYCTASIWSLCVIALDRFTATTFPVWYRDKRSLNRAMWYTAIVWIFSIIVTVPPLFGWQDRSMNYQYSNITLTYHCILFQNIEYVIYSALGSFIIPLFLMLVLYLKIFTVLRKRSQQLNKAHQRNQQNRRAPSKKGNAERKRVPPQDIELSTISKGEDSKFLFTYSTDSSPDPDMKSDEEDILSSADNSRLNSPAYITDKDSTHVSLIQPHKFRNGLMSTTEATDSDTMVISNPSRFTETDKESQSDQEKVKLVQAQHDQKSQDSPTVKDNETDDGHHKKHVKGANPFKRDRLRSSFRKFDKREQRATKRMGMIISCFFVCWMPFTLMYLIRALCTYCAELNPNLQAFIIWLGYANSGLNPILYTIFNEDFRKAFIKLVCCCWPWAMKYGKKR
jgi:hypothetical protein